MGKKGQESVFNTLLAVIGVLLALGVVFVLITYFGDKGSEAAKVIACKDSVILRGNIKVPNTLVSNEEKLLPLVCPTFEEGDVEGDKQEQLLKISDMAATCWFMFAEGKITNLFNNEDYGGKSCKACYMFQIPSNSGRIYAGELGDFMANKSYSPALLYGGGTKKYVGDRITKTDGLSIEMELGETEELKLSEIVGIPVNSFIRDYSGLIDESTKERINVVGQQFLSKDVGNLFVIVADDLAEMDKQAATSMAEKLELNDKDYEGKVKYNSIILIVGLENNEVRLHMGATLAQYIEEFEIKDVLSKHFSTIRTRQDLNSQLAAAVEGILAKVTSEQQSNQFVNLKLRTDTYLAYLSSDGKSPPIMEDIEPGRTMVIAYMAPSDDVNFWSEAWGRTKNFFSGWGVGVLWDITFPKENSIVIAQLNTVSEYCDTE